MGETMQRAAGQGLERSCEAPSRCDWLRVAPPADGIERLEAWFSGHAYDRHRHDSYAIGLTHQGVQAFRYRGAERASTPGQVLVLYPDETHDGHAGAESGFGYQMLYLEPRLMIAALEELGAGLPFVSEAVFQDRALAATIVSAFEGFPAPLDELQQDHLVVRLADLLLRHDHGQPRRRRPSLARRQVALAQALLDADFARTVSSAELERLTGLDRFALARHFRASLGTSPYRYLTLRRLEAAKCLSLSGLPLAEVAAAAGFADQSHMTRQFKQAYGLPPGRFLKLASAA